MLRTSLLIASILCAVIGNAGADDLGVIGPTYKITEKDLIDVIKDKLQSMKKNGQLDKLQDDYKKEVLNSVERPRAVAGITKTIVDRTHYVDPTWKLEQNVVDANGKILYAAGTRINPFDYDKMTKSFLFFDESDEQQVIFARRYIAESAIPVKPVLVSGQPMKLMREWKRPVYFDQGGTLTRRFSITHVPAIVTQEGRKFRVDEIKP